VNLGESVCVAAFDP